jgi:hypothetical protein
MTLGLPGAQGLFSTLQERLCNPDAKSHLRLSTIVHNFLDDFRCLTAMLSDCTTKIAELLPQAPLTIGASNASGTGMGGIHFIPHPDGSIQPCIWYQILPTELITRLVTNANPSGNITISDLELAVTITHRGILAHYINIWEQTTNNLHAHTSAVYWQQGDPLPGQRQQHTFNVCRPSTNFSTNFSTNVSTNVSINVSQCTPICRKNERYGGRFSTLVGSFRLTIACPF